MESFTVMLEIYNLSMVLLVTPVANSPFLFSHSDSYPWPKSYDNHSFARPFLERGGHPNEIFYRRYHSTPGRFDRIQKTKIILPEIP